MPRMKKTAVGRTEKEEESQEASDHEKCRSLAVGPKDTPVLEAVEIQRDGRYNDNKRQRDGALRAEVVESPVEEIVDGTEKCCASAETGMKKRKVEETSEVSRKVTGVTQLQTENQTHRQMEEPAASQQTVPKEAERELKCYAQDTMNELLGMFGYDGVDEEEASSLHVSSRFVPSPPPPAPLPAPTQDKEGGTPGRCRWCKRTFKGAALNYVLKLPDMTKAYCSADCLARGEDANNSNAAPSHSSQTMSNETGKEHKRYAQDTMNELLGMYRYDGDKTRNLQMSSRVVQTPSSSTPHHESSPAQREGTLPTAMKCCMMCNTETAALDFVLKLPDGSLQAYCSGMCLAQGKALAKKMSAASESLRPFFSLNHNKNITSFTEDGNKVSHKKQCTELRHQTKLENKQKKPSVTFTPAETQEEKKSGTASGCCMWCKKISAALDFVHKLPDGKLHAYCSADCLSKGNISKQRVQAQKNSSTAQSLSRQPLGCTQDKTSPTPDSNKVFHKEQCAESYDRRKNTKNTNSCVFWLCHCCKKTVPGDRVITSNSGKFCSEDCVSKHQKPQ
ncbi:uncharacterized protein [Branchiostoma lanceolatum]|uniref:uncharacterized protein isoform X1 n=1 Tax=Branchiostoma lanceolatum TaxID=7740 RepID=UPI003454543C